LSALWAGAILIVETIITSATTAVVLRAERIILASLNL
jgi:hypothetical protein